MGLGDKWGQLILDLVILRQLIFIRHIHAISWRIPADLNCFKLLTRAENSATALSTLMFQSRRVRSQRSKVDISLEFPSGCV